MVYIICIAMVATACLVFRALAGRRGEDCPGYPYDCPYCHHAAECIIEIGRKDDHER